MQLEFLYLTFRSQPGVQDVHLRRSCSFDTDTILLRINKNKKTKQKKNRKSKVISCMTMSQQTQQISH